MDTHKSNSVKLLDIQQKGLYKGALPGMSKSVYLVIERFMAISKLRKQSLHVQHFHSCTKCLNMVGTYSL